MKEINIPDSIRYVSKGAFFNTSVFEVVDNLYMIDRKIVTGATKYEETMEIPDGVIGICNEAFYMFLLSDENLVNVKLPKSIKFIGESAFSGHVNLRNINLPESLEIMDSNCFEYTNIEKIKIPSKITSISRFAFYGCSNLSEVKLNKNLQSIGARAFDSCSSLVSITIPNKVTSIDGYAFNKCKSLQKIVIGKKVEMIDSSAFDNCESLYSISFLGKCPTLTNRYDITPIFVDSANLQKISVPKKYVSAYKNVFTNYKIVYNK